MPPHQTQGELELDWLELGSSFGTIQIKPKSCAPPCAFLDKMSHEITASFIHKKLTIIKTVTRMFRQRTVRINANFHYKPRNALSHLAITARF
ncbi:hypothetical protein EDL57_13390 [Vibrio cholerae]|nr:hypothetical protein [Vibrio cholerae]EGR2122129.1 hypothetical protein [Vibrio cholerae]